jgi:hypothetical protein
LKAAAFNRAGRIYAPRYRQMAAAGYFNLKQGAPALEVALSDCERAFEHFLEHFATGGRPLILAAHSQGASVHPS